MLTVNKRAGAGWITARERAWLASECVRRYRDGQTIRVIAREIGGSYGSVHRLLTAAGVVLRSRGPRRKATA